jgi:hypothetical protein
VLTSKDFNKENVRPIMISKVAQSKKSFNMVGQPLSRPEEMIQSYENIKLMHPQELLKEIYM